jgi:beta-xylosidase
MISTSRFTRRALTLCVVCSTVAILLLSAQPLTAMQDQGNGTYRNPVLFSDYSDPDILRAGDKYYLVASSFHFMPGIPVLESHDLVNWRIVGHVFPKLDIDPRYNMVGGNRYGQGAWAPALRFHNGLFYVYFPTPQEGIFMSSAPSPAGPWTKPVAVIAGRGYEDPCPFWDDDGNAYLLHGRVGAGPLVLHHMSPDGEKVLDDGKVIVDDRKQLPTLEGPKLYRRGRYYYIFAPFGGVGTGSQAVLRATSLYGPWESRTVLTQGSTIVNGPHQGGYVQTQDGHDWFLHFSQRGGYGRIDYLEPMQWSDDWPVIGKPLSGTTAGEPVEIWAKPGVGKIWPIETPQTSDEFSGEPLGLQWEWNHNPDDALWSLKTHRGFLRLKAAYAPDLINARNTLTEQMQHESFDLTTRIVVSGMKDGERAGLAMFGVRAAWIGVTQADGKRQIIFANSIGEDSVVELHVPAVLFRVHVAEEQASFSWSADDGRTFTPVGGLNRFYFSWWKAARPAIFNFNTDSSAADKGSIDVDWVHYVPHPAKQQSASPTGNIEPPHSR